MRIEMQKFERRNTYTPKSTSLALGSVAMSLNREETLKKKFYVYQLRAGNQDLPFYIGKGHHKNRKYQHTSNINNGNTNLKNNKIRKCLRQNIRILAEVLFESNNEQECFDKEIELINFYGRRDIGTGILTNMTDGGEGISGRIMPIKERQYRSRIMRGHIKSPETCDKLSISKMGHGVSEETKTKISKTVQKLWDNEHYDRNNRNRHQFKKGHIVTDETKRKISESNKEKIITEKQRNSISETLKGRKRLESSVDKGSKYTRGEATNHIISQKQSGVTQKEYCEKHNIKEQTFCGWKRSPFVIAKGFEQERCKPFIVTQTRRNNRSIQTNRKGFKPSIRRKRYKFQPNDLLRYSGKEQRVKGMFNYGTYIRLEDGTNTNIKNVGLINYGKGIQFN